MFCIRVFRTKKEADWARNILEGAGIMVVIEHDKFEGIPIERLGVSARFRLMIDRSDLNRAAKFLAKKLKKEL